MNEQKLQEAATAAGMTPEAFAEAMERTRENLRKLQLCGKHQFVDATQDRAINKVFQCMSCKGTVSAEAAYWYAEGFRHGVITTAMH